MSEPVYNTVEEEFIIEPPTEFEQMKLDENEWTSLYIPVIPDNFGYNKKRF